MKQTTTAVFALPVRPYPLSESLVLRNKRAYEWVPMRWFPVQHRRCCQRKRQGLPQSGASSINRCLRLMRKPLFVFNIRRIVSLFLLSFVIAIASQPAFAAVNNKAVTLPALPCINTLNTLPEMQLIPAGVFNRGSPKEEKGRDDDEGPVDQVAVYRSFALSRCEITVGQFKRFIAETGYETDAERGGCNVLNKEATGGELKASANWKSPGFNQTDDHPVVCISWQDAKAYTRWLSAITSAIYRLPTETEWEYAARTLDGSAFSRYWGDDPDKGCEFANGADQSLKDALPAIDFTIANCNDGAVYTQIAGSYARNAFGLSDMLGNVWEWVEDCYHESYEAAPLDGSAWQKVTCDRRVVRGGGWYDIPEFIRSANRNRNNPDDADDNSGFRIARAL